MQVILPSGQAVEELQPQFDAIRKCPGRGIIISGVAPLGSGFDYYYRYFGPKFGINEVKYLVSNNVNAFQKLDVINQFLDNIRNPLVCGVLLEFRTKKGKGKKVTSLSVIV